MKEEYLELIKKISDCNKQLDHLQVMLIDLIINGSCQNDRDVVSHAISEKNKDLRTYKLMLADFVTYHSDLVSKAFD